MPNVMAVLPNIGGALCSMPHFGWRPLLKYRAVTVRRRETRWNLLGCPKLANSSQPLLGRSSPYYYVMWRRYSHLTFFPTVDTCLSCEDMARQSCVMVPRWQFFCVLCFQLAVGSTFQTCILNSHKGHTMCGNMVDIQSTTAEIRPGKKIEEK